jgi:hypothetical protein
MPGSAETIARMRAMEKTVADLSVIAGPLRGREIRHPNWAK